MSTADPFTALGVGNGFSFCPSKVDISGYSSWVTLDGYSGSGDPDIAASREAAMKLWWNAKTTNVSTSASFSFTTNDPDGGNDASVSASVSSVNFSGDVVGESNSLLQPKERLCPPDDFYGFVLSGYNLAEDDDEGFFVQVRAEHLLQIVAMYNGVTSNENNFVGYGVQLRTDGTAIRTYTGVNACVVELVSYTNEISETQTGGSFPDDFKTVQSVGTTTISGLSFICVAFATGYVGGSDGSPSDPGGQITVSSNPTASASSRTASSTSTVTEIEEVDNPSPPPDKVTYTTTTVENDSATITSIDFWTYS